MQGLLNQKSLMCKGYSESNASYSIMSAYGRCWWYGNTNAQLVGKYYIFELASVEEDKSFIL